MKHPKLTEVLQKMTFFRGFSSDDIEKFIESSKAKEVKPGEIIFSDGDSSDSIFFLISGTLEVFSNGVPIAEIGDFGVVGEMGAVTGMPRTASVIAKTLSRVLAMKRLDLMALVDSDPVMGVKLYRNVVKILSKYVRKGNVSHETMKHSTEDDQA